MTDAELTVALLRESRETLDALYEEDQLAVPSGRSVQMNDVRPTGTTLEDAMRQLRLAMQELLADDEPSRR